MEQIIHLVEIIHFGCFKLCKKILGEYLSVAGNVGIFCQNQEEYEALSSIRSQITNPSDNPNQKYYELKTPITIHSKDGIPEATYNYLYIRKPQSDSPERGDIDFVFSENMYREFKKKVLIDKQFPGAHIYDRSGWDAIELRDESINVLAYIGTQKMAEKARIRF